MNTTKEINYFKDELNKYSNPDRAIGEKRYLKSPMDHYGVTMPQIRKIALTWIKDHPEVNVDEIVKLCQKLWNTHWHEERMIVDSLLEANRHQLSIHHLPIIETFITTVTGWAQLDGVAVLAVGSIVDKDKNAAKYLSKWIKSDNFWVRRAAILSQILEFRRGQGDFKLFEHLVAPQFAEGKDWSKEERFFIRKAIGWALRELAPHNPEAAFNFAKKYKTQMSGLTYREATRKLPTNYQTKLASL